MSAERLGWLGVRTDRFKQMTALYRDLLGLEAFQIDERPKRSRSAERRPSVVRPDLTERAPDSDRFAGTSMRPAGFEPATRGLEVRRSVH